MPAQIADIVADVVGDGCGIASIIFRNPLEPDEIAADIGAFVKCTAQPGKDGRQ